MKKIKTKDILIFLVLLGAVIADIVFLRFLRDISFLIAFIVWIFMFIKFKLSYKHFLSTVFPLFISQVFFLASPDTWIKDRISSWIFFLIFFSAVFSIIERKKT